MRGCPREADACGSALPRDLHSVTAVTLSVLRPGPIGSSFPGLAIQDFLHVLCLLLPAPVEQLCGDIGSAVRVPHRVILREGGEGKGVAPFLQFGCARPRPSCICSYTSLPAAPPSHLHMQVSPCPAAAAAEPPRPLLSRAARPAPRYVRPPLVPTPRGASRSPLASPLSRRLPQCAAPARRRWAGPSRRSAPWLRRLRPDRSGHAGAAAPLV